MKQNQQIEIVIACKHVLIGHTLKLLIEQQEDYTVVHIADTSKSLQSFLTCNFPQLLITEIELKDADSFNVLERLNIESTLHILCIVDTPLPYIVSYALKNGAKGILPLNASSEELYIAIETVSKGESHYNEYLTAGLIRNQLVKGVTQ